MTTLIDIDKTCDGEKYVVVINTTGEIDGWNDLSEPFDTYIQAKTWADKIKSNHIRIYDLPL
jgi:hypothetical protein